MSRTDPVLAGLCPLAVRQAARLQMSLWLDDMERIATGVQHYRAPIVRWGQWVRLIGFPGYVQTPGRTPQRGAYGQVNGFIDSGRRVANVLFVGHVTYANVRVFDLEPLVGTPVGRPRDHLRKFRRALTAWRRAVKEHGSSNFQHLLRRLTHVRG